MKLSTCLLLSIVAITATCGDAQECSSSLCTNDFEPVCASNDITYYNECWLNFAICESSGDITKAQDGGCTTTGSAASLAADSIPMVANNTDKCPEACTMIYKPVCGSDGVTYGNDCTLGIASCESDGSITKVSEGECASLPTENTCEKLCIEIFKPVCGSNGVTYSNSCFLSIAACNDRSITQVSEGPCGGSPYPHKNC